MWAKSYFSAKFPPTVPPPLLCSCLASCEGHSVLSQTFLFPFVLLFTLMFSFPFSLHLSQRLNDVAYANTISQPLVRRHRHLSTLLSSQARLQDSKLITGEQVAVGINMMSRALLDPPWYPHISTGLAAMAEDLNQTHVFPKISSSP